MKSKKLTSEQFVLLRERVLKEQGFIYDIAKEICGDYPAYMEGEMDSLCGIFFCHDCETFYPKSEALQHPAYILADICPNCVTKFSDEERQAAKLALKARHAEDCKDKTKY